MKKKTPTDKTITLCMIVKNETHIVHECLESMVPYIDRYDITDTGSTDGTPEKIKEIMDKHNIPGEVYLSDWKGFGDHSGKMGSRTESLRNCDGKADYAWVIDADDKIEGDFKYPDHMDADAYSLRIGRQDFVWWRNQIFKTGVDWRYIGVLHEYAECKGIETITDDLLTYREGCDIIMRKTGKDSYFGGTSTCECYVNWNGIDTFVQNEVKLTKDEYHVTDKGLHKENRSKVWGSDYGAFKFVRQTPS